MNWFFIVFSVFAHVDLRFYVELDLSQYQIIVAKITLLSGYLKKKNLDKKVTLSLKFMSLTSFIVSFVSFLANELHSVYECREEERQSVNIIVQKLQKMDR